MVKAYLVMCNCGIYYVESDEYIRVRLYNISSGAAKSIRLYSESGIFKHFKVDRYKQALSDGWFIDGRRFHKARVHMTKCSITEKVNTLDIKYKLDNGWKRSIVTAVVKCGNLRFITLNKVENHLSDGWSIGGGASKFTDEGQLTLLSKCDGRRFTYAEAGRYLGISRKTVIKWASAFNKSHYFDIGIVR